MGNHLRRLPWDVDDFDSNRDVVGMSTCEEGVMLFLIRLQWRGGPIPTRLEDLLRISGKHRRYVAKYWDKWITRLFPLCENGTEGRENKGLAETRERAEAEYRAKARGGKNRWASKGVLEESYRSPKQKRVGTELNRTELNRKEPGLEKETSPAPASLDLLNLIAGTEVSLAWKEYISEIVAIVEKHSEGPMEVESIVDAIRNGSINEPDRFTVSSLLRFANSKKIKVPESPGKTEPKHKSDPDIYRERSPSINLTGTIDEMMGKLKEALPGWTWKRWRAAEALASREDAMLQGKYVKGLLG